jgi:hypothetical protein
VVPPKFWLCQHSRPITAANRTKLQEKRSFGLLQREGRAMVDAPLSAVAELSAIQGYRLPTLSLHLFQITIYYIILFCRMQERFEKKVKNNRDFYRLRGKFRGCFL